MRNTIEVAENEVLIGTIIKKPSVKVHVHLSLGKLGNLPSNLIGNYAFYNSGLEGVANVIERSQVLKSLGTERVLQRKNHQDHPVTRDYHL